ncbi:MAG: AIR synthase related protein [Promethearchaeota archaeon]
MNEKNELYAKLGVSSKKEDVHEAVKKLDKGLFPGAFCKIVEDISGRQDYCSIFHSDGAGTKASLAYMYYKETGDISIFRGIVRDAIVMNIDDVMCVGATGKMFISNNLSRNSKLISGEIVKIIIEEYQNYCNKISQLGIPLILTGGETADVGDLVRTLVVDASLFTIMERKNIIDLSNIREKDIIIGLSSEGKASYEEEYNSGISSNGLTLARHGMLSHVYYKKYPECYDDNLNESLIFFGKYKLDDKPKGLKINVGKALLSPTRTYAPILLEILKNYHKEIHGIIHNTGGGQIKDLHYGNGIIYIKDNLFKIPIIFELIQESSGTSWKEMYSVFNMGHRMELFCSEKIADDLIGISKKFNIDAKIIGYCEKNLGSQKNIVKIFSEYGDFIYE